MKYTIYTWGVRLADTQRIELYYVLKLASKEGKVNKFEMETFLTRLAEEEISVDDYMDWLGRARTNLLTETENTYEDLYNFLRKHKKKYAEDFKKNAKWPDEIKFQTTKEQLTHILSEKVNIAFADLIGKELRKHGITLSEFNKMRMKSMINLSDEEVRILKAIRDSVVRPDEDAVLQKTIPIHEIKNYMGENGYSKIRGYVAKRVDVKHLKTYDDVLEALRLDYLDADGNRTYPTGGDSFGYIKFRTKETDMIGIPYGEKFGGNNTDG